MHKLFSKRSIVGTLLLLILIGEPTVGQKTGLFSPGGIIIFFFLYLSLFHLFESLITNYQMVWYQVVLLTFALYSVFVTGFLNKELTEYILQPNFFITLIRIQASFFVAFAFYLLNSFLPRKNESVFSVTQSLIFFSIFVIVISASKVWGIPSLLFTLQIAPQFSVIFGILAVFALIKAFQKNTIFTQVRNKKLTAIAVMCFILGAIPSLFTFIGLLILMICGGVYSLVDKKMRYYKF